MLINWCESNLSAIQWAYHSMCKALPSAAQVSIVNLLLLVFFPLFCNLYLSAYSLCFVIYLPVVYSFFRWDRIFCMHLASSPQISLFWDCISVTSLSALLYQWPDLFFEQLPISSIKCSKSTTHLCVTSLFLSRATLQKKDRKNNTANNWGTCTPK